MHAARATRFAVASVLSALGLAILLSEHTAAASVRRAAAVGWLDVSVRRGPIVPVCVEGEPCDGPAPGITVLIFRQGVRVGRAVTDAAGLFQRRVRTGVYTVRVASAPGPGRGFEPRTVRVRAGRHTRVTLSIDTGIR